MKNLIKTLLVSISILTTSCSNAGLVDKVARGPTLKIVKQQEYLRPQGDYRKEPDIIIDVVTPVTCTNYPDGMFGSDCILDDEQPIPEKIEFRYGVWMSREEADKRFPPIPFEAFENNHNSDDYNSLDEYLAADKAFREKVFNQPKYKKVREAKFAAMEREIDWHTYTIYPKQILEKYHKEMGFINRMRASIIYYTLTFHYDMSVTEQDSILYLDPAKPW